MLNQNSKFKRVKSGLLFAICFVVVGCAHESKVPLSKGHIDGGLTPQNTNQNAPDNVVNTAPIPKLVRNSPQLPIPKQTTKVQTYSVVVNEVPVKEILFALARESKLNIDIHPSIQGRVTLNAVDQTLPAILERLAKQVDLTYKMDGNVLYISPDQPVLRIYKVDYVNMNRDTKGFIGAAAEISSTGQSASTGANGSNTTTSTSGNGAKNSSSTSVDSTSKNHLWESLIQNLKELLAETDKEVIVSRFGSVPEPSAATTPAATSLAEAARATTEERNQQRSEYKTLFAANVIANPETGVISVRATNKQHEKVQEFIDKVIGSAKKQVLIEATIVEVRLNDSYQAGIDWSRFGNRGTSSDGFTFNQALGPSIGPGSTAGAGIAVGYINQMSSLGNLAASVTLLKQFGDTKVLSSPKLMVLNNQTAVLKVVDNIVYFTIQAQISQSASGVSGTNLQSFTTTPNTVPVGVVMSVTPQISDSSMVNINVRPTISRTIGPGKQDPNPQLVYQTGVKQGEQIVSLIPEIQVREMESMLQISSGNTAVLGGLMQDEIQRNTDGVPGLMDVPGVGNIFKGRDDLNRKTELVIFLRPTVISNASLESDELQSYKQYLPAQQLQNVLEEAN
ncbi:pilus (MSHA type) biogenesis protein MshL [Methylotenera versatilis]|uniref:pilus (MSHA type) biogenesis protein MshL n=1 Tax=Methylotenera versatilis TaxID=1055487 RepID=UPI000AF4B017